MRCLLFFMLCSMLQPCFSQTGNSFAVAGFGVGSNKGTSMDSALGIRFCFGAQKQWNNKNLRIEPLLRYARYSTPKSRENSKGKINGYHFDLNLQHDFIHVGSTTMIIGAGVGYQMSKGQIKINSGQDSTVSVNRFSQKGIGINASLGIRFYPTRSRFGMEIILYEINHQLQSKTHEIGILNLRLIYSL